MSFLLVILTTFYGAGAPVETTINCVKIGGKRKKWDSDFLQGVAQSSAKELNNLLYNSPSDNDKVTTKTTKT